MKPLRNKKRKKIMMINLKRLKNRKKAGCKNKYRKLSKSSNKMSNSKRSTGNKIPTKTKRVRTLIKRRKSKQAQAPLRRKATSLIKNSFLR